jgi:prolyl-tRNA editing enzyme YbaK/EbsC (Cys-tRNA(Pro) deacylase)
VNPLPAAARRVQDALSALGSAARMREMPASTRTAADAAAACGCAEGAIVKSLIFRGAGSGQGILVLTSGANRVHEARLGRQLGETLERADADFVRAATGYAIGGVPPLGHPAPLPTWIDDNLLVPAEVWAAAGTPRHVFVVAPADLVVATGATVAVLREGV